MHHWNPTNALQQSILVSIAKISHAECKPPIVVYICTIYLQVYLKGIDFVIANHNYV